MSPVNKTGKKSNYFTMDDSLAKPLEFKGIIPDLYNRKAPDFFQGFWLNYTGNTALKA